LAPGKTAGKKPVRKRNAGGKEDTKKEQMDEKKKNYNKTRKVSRRLDPAPVGKKQIAPWLT